MKHLIALLIAVIILSPGIALAKGGGFHSSGSRSFSASRSATPVRTSTAKPTTVKPVTPTKPTVATKPTTTTPKVSKATPTIKNGKTFSSTGSVVGAGYQPRFRGGIVPPSGSVVYYRDNSFLDYLPLYYILFHDAHRDAIVETPGQNGAPTTTQVMQEEGIDTMYVWNWVFTILVGLGLIGFVVWLINKATKK